MSKDKITELLLNQKANEATVTQFMALLANCEMARYSQHHTDASMEKDFWRCCRSDISTRQTSEKQVIDKQK